MKILRCISHPLFAYSFFGSSPFIGITSEYIWFLRSVLDISIFSLSTNSSRCVFRFIVYYQYLVRLIIQWNPETETEVRLPNLRIIGLSFGAIDTKISKPV